MSQLGSDPEAPGKKSGATFLDSWISKHIEVCPRPQYSEMQLKELGYGQVICESLLCYKINRGIRIF